ncbi:glutamate--tRNA ligase [Patescibacteria group bacterium]|nr:glutamate--tRNA ligase [Patescibacteria group bacterium]
MDTPKTRFAPSPTGYLHIGNLRSALYAYLFAKKNNGTFVLRIEDTDQARTISGATEGLINMLTLFGLHYDEGPIFEGDTLAEKGKNGPYIQSKRSEIYKKYAKELVANSAAYPCFCKKERLNDMRSSQEKKGLPVKYDKQCAHLAKEVVEEKLKNNEPHVIRLNVTPGEIITFYDVVRGKVEINSSDIDDQVLLKSDGHATYHLANVVDDHLMDITHVIRGEEWLPSTPKHILIYQAFEWKPPKFAHLPLVLNPDKSKLSKRQGNVAVEDYLREGYLKEALTNFIAFLGWNPKNDRELFTLKELEEVFSLKSINKSGAVFNVEKLNWYNKQYIKKLSDNEFVDTAKPFLMMYDDNDQEIVKKAILLEKDRIEKFSDLADAIAFFFAPPEYDVSLLSWKKITANDAQKNLTKLLPVLESISDNDYTKDALEKTIFAFLKENNYKVGEFLWPLRVALSGKKFSPGPFEIADILGKNETLKRVEDSRQK